MPVKAALTLSAAATQKHVLMVARMAIWSQQASIRPTMGNSKIKNVLPVVVGIPAVVLSRRS